MNDIFMIIGFIVFLILFCVFWNKLMMIRYKKLKREYKKIDFGIYINNLSCLKLVGTGIDGNSDHEVDKAIKKIKLSNNVRIKLNE